MPLQIVKLSYDNGKFVEKVYELFYTCATEFFRDLNELYHTMFRAEITQAGLTLPQSYQVLSNGQWGVVQEDTFSKSNIILSVRYLEAPYAEGFSHEVGEDESKSSGEQKQSLKVFTGFHAGIARYPTLKKYWMIGLASPEAYSFFELTRPDEEKKVQPLGDIRSFESKEVQLLTPEVEGHSDPLMRKPMDPIKFRYFELLPVKAKEQDENSFLGIKYNDKAPQQLRDRALPVMTEMKTRIPFTSGLCRKYLFSIGKNDYWLASNCIYQVSDNHITGLVGLNGMEPERTHTEDLMKRGTHFLEDVHGNLLIEGEQEKSYLRIHNVIQQTCYCDYPEPIKVELMYFKKRLYISHNNQLLGEVDVHMVKDLSTISIR